MQFFNGYALLIGAGEFIAQFSPLPPAINNAETLYQTLTMQSGYRSANTTRLTGPTATRAQILNHIAQNLLAKNNFANNQPVLKPSTLFLFYFSGYGCLEKATGRYFLLPYDVNPLNLARTALSTQDLAAALAQLPVGPRLVILDCNPLREGQQETWDQRVGQAYTLIPPPPEILEAFCQPGSIAGAVSSAEGKKFSTIDQNSGGSLFTAELIHILSGEVAGINNGLLQVETLYDHLIDQVRRTALHIYRRDQQPMARLSGPSFPVAVISETAKGIEPGREDAGRENAEREESHHGQHAKPPVHGPGLPPGEIPQGDEAFSSGIDFAIGSGESAGPVMRGGSDAKEAAKGADVEDQYTKGAESGPPTAQIDTSGSKGAAEQHNGTEINTGGGTYVGGSVSTGGGNFVGRDQINNVNAKYMILLDNGQGTKIGDNLRLLKEDDKIIGQLSLRLAIAAPKRVYLHEAFQIAAAIRLPASPALQVNGLPSVSVDEFTALQTQKEYIQLHLQVHESASYRVTGKSYYDIAYLPGTDSALYYFELEALQTGKIYIILEITQNLGSIGSTRIVTTAAARKKPAGRVVAEVESHPPLKLDEVMAVLNQLTEQIKSQDTRDQAAVALRSLAAEARQGEQASAGRVQLWLGVLESCTPEIWKAALATFRQPIEGVGSMVRKIAEAEAMQTQ